MKFKAGDKVVAKNDYFHIGIRKDEFSILKKEGDYFVFKSPRGSIFKFEGDSPFEYYFEKIENESMKFEEVLPQYRNGEIIEYSLPNGEWQELLHMCHASIAKMAVDLILDGKFRIKTKKEKVKRYQVLYYIFYQNNKKKFFKTSLKKYIDENDFNKRNDTENLSGENLIFKSLISESEEEFDE